MASSYPEIETADDFGVGMAADNAKNISLLKGKDSTEIPAVGTPDKESPMDTDSEEAQEDTTAGVPGPSGGTNDEGGGEKLSFEEQLKREAEKDPELAEALKEINFVTNPVTGTTEASTGAFRMNIKCPTMASLNNLWSKFESGDLEKDFSDAFNIEEMKKEFNLPDLKMDIKITRNTYDRVRRNIEEKERKENIRALLYAETQDDLEKVKECLEKGADADTAWPDGMTGLHIAAQFNSPGLAKLMVQHGCEINSLDNVGLTPLHHAAQCNHVDIARYLVNAGADMTVTDTQGFTAQQLAERNGHDTIVHSLQTTKSDSD